jgi:glycosyltransferase involved in cell wall biosynthesis
MNQEMPGEPLDISIVTPIYNEVENIPELVERTFAVMEGMERSFEMILVDDGSTDGSEAV